MLARQKMDILEFVKHCDCCFTVKLQGMNNGTCPMFHVVDYLKHFGVPFEEIPKDFYYFFRCYDRQKNPLNLRLI